MLVAGLNGVELGWVGSGEGILAFERQLMRFRGISVAVARAAFAR